MVAVLSENNSYISPGPGSWHTDAFHPLTGVTGQPGQGAVEPLSWQTAVGSTVWVLLVLKLELPCIPVSRCRLMETVWEKRSGGLWSGGQEGGSFLCPY